MALSKRHLPSFYWIKRVIFLFGLEKAFAAYFDSRRIARTTRDEYRMGLHCMRCICIVHCSTQVVYYYFISALTQSCLVQTLGRIVFLQVSFIRQNKCSGVHIIHILGPWETILFLLFLYLRNNQTALNGQGCTSIFRYSTTLKYYRMPSWDRLLTVGSVIRVVSYSNPSSKY